MKNVYRYDDNATYWDKRWENAKEDAQVFTSLDIYPIKYAEMVMKDRSKYALEIGCGLGRVLKHYHYRGFNIEGIERSKVAVQSIKEEGREILIQQGDAVNLPYRDNSFDVVMAFGVYHNFEHGLEEGVSEVSRILKSNGRYVISMRPNNIEMHLNEYYWRYRQKHRNNENRSFHKVLVGKREFEKILEDRNLIVENTYYSRNLSTLYRLTCLRDKSQKTETERRSGGYRLNRVGRIIDKLICTVAPYQSSNVIIFIGRKKQ